MTGPLSLTLHMIPKPTPSKPGAEQFLSPLRTQTRNALPRLLQLINVRGHRHKIPGLRSIKPGTGRHAQVLQDSKVKNIILIDTVESSSLP